MVQIFTDFASWMAYHIFALSPEIKQGDAVHFFIEDVSKIFVLLPFIIYFIAQLHASITVEKVRDYLQKVLAI